MKGKAVSEIRLKYAAHIEMGQSPPSTEYNDESSLPFLQGTADFGKEFPAPTVFCDTPNKVAFAGDILFSVRAPVGEINLANQRCGIGRGLCAIRANSQFNTRFIWWALHEIRWQLNYVTTGSTYDAVSAEDVSNLYLPDNSFKNQQIIAEFLDRETEKIDALIAAKERVIELLVEKKQGLITHTVIHGLDPNAALRNSDLPWLGFIPKHWLTRRAKFLFKQSALPVRDDDGIVTCFRDGQVTLRKNRREEGFTNAIKELGYQGIRIGQLVLHSMDAFAGAIGVSDSEGKCSPEYIICDPIENNISTLYYGLLLRVMALNGFIQASCPAVRERAPRIRFSDFAKMFIPIPPISEQYAIVSHIEEETAKLDTFREAIDRTIVLLKERRAALITAAVTGQIDV